MRIKYLYNVYHLLDSYPTDEDIHYQIVKYQTDNDKLGEEFSDKGVKSILEYKVEPGILSERLNSLVLSGYLETRPINPKDTKIYYKLVKTVY